MRPLEADAPVHGQWLRQFFRFNLRHVLLLVAILCGFLAWASRDVHVAYRRQRLITAVEQLGGSVGSEESAPAALSIANWIGTFWDMRLATKVTELNLWGTEITDRDIEQLVPLIQQVPDRLSISFHGTSIGDEAVARLASCSRLRHIGLSGTRISDQCAPSLAQLVGLEGLTLENTAITDRTLLSLQSLANLTVLDVSQT